MNSYIRWPRRVTVAAIGCPSRRRNEAIDFLAFFDHRFLAGDGGQILNHPVEDLYVMGCFTHPGVDDDLVQLGDHHHVLEVQFLFQGGDDFRFVFFKKSAHVVP